jgi:hypothetical protein
MFDNHSEYMQYIATEMDVEERNRNRNSGYKDEYEIRGFLDRAGYLRFLTYAYPADKVYELSNKLGSRHDFGELITQLKKLKNKP